MMVVDTSAIVAIFLTEPDAPLYETAIANAEILTMSASSYVELSLVLRGRRTGGSDAQIDAFLTEMNIGIAAFTTDQARIARDAHARFGKGSGHPAQLNFGDCFSYALAQALDAPLLFKGADFSHTDIRPALKP
jgi:ribonuclease VapC